MRKDALCKEGKSRGKREKSEGEAKQVGGGAQEDAKTRAIRMIYDNNEWKAHEDQEGASRERKLR